MAYWESPRIVPIDFKVKCAKILLFAVVVRRPPLTATHHGLTGQTTFQQADDSTKSPDGKQAKTVIGEHLYPDGRGIDGALLDLEFQRIELTEMKVCLVECLARSLRH